MSFTRTWGQPVRDAVERMALSPDRLSARAIHDALAVGAIDGIKGPDVPPASTVARWVHEHRRAAREVVDGDGAGDTMTLVVTRLRKRLRGQARDARTAAEIRAVAGAARELAALERELKRDDTPKGKGASKARDTPAAATQDDEQRAFLEAMARDASASAPSSGNGRHEMVRGAQPRTEQNGRKSGRAAAQ